MLVLLCDSFERFLLSRLDTIVKTESLAGGNARRSTAAPQFRCLLKADVLKAKAGTRRIWKWVSGKALHFDMQRPGWRNWVLMWLQRRKRWLSWLHPQTLQLILREWNIPHFPTSISRPRTFREHRDVTSEILYQKTRVFASLCIFCSIYFFKRNWRWSHWHKACV